jgi:hypothetical protein
MHRQPVASSSISEIGFDAATSTLEVLFANGRVYEYYDVPERVFQDLLAAASVGQFFQTEVRGVYRFARV